MIKGCESIKQSLNEILEALEFAQKIHLMYIVVVTLEVLMYYVSLKEECSKLKLYFQAGNDLGSSKKRGKQVGPQLDN